ncbi:MAG: hypothetical protein J6J24_02605 [Clostridia bacterium]|nr:hypothetical protein [Clostridia bacterium]
MKNILSKNVVETLYRCGDYHGSNGCDYRETSFGNYLYTISNIALREGTANKSEEYLQGKIDLAIEIIEDLAKTYIDEDNMCINFDESEFSKMGANFSFNSGLMPYVIHYVALKNGFDFAPQHQEFCRVDMWDINGPVKMDVKLIHCAPITDEEMVKSTVNTIIKYNQWILENGGVEERYKWTYEKDIKKLEKLIPKEDKIKE